MDKAGCYKDRVYEIKDTKNTIPIKSNIRNTGLVKQAEWWFKIKILVEDAPEKVKNAQNSSQTI